MKFDRIDIPTPDQSYDKLSRAKLLENLERVLIDKEGGKRRATRVVAGLNGPWGSGKSSIMRLLSQRLTALGNVAVVEFNPWIFKNSDELLDAFFGEMRAQLGSNKREKAEAIVEALDGYRDAIEPVANAVYPGSGLVSKFIPRHKSSSVIKKREILEEKLSKFDGAVVVLVDELDRVEDDDIRSMARLIKAVGDLPNISYLVAYDRGRVERALGHGDEQEGSRYLQKIIQFSVPIRPLMDYEARDLIREQLTDRGVDPDLGDPELMELLLAVMLPLLETPRDVKRLIGSFGALYPMVIDEVNSIDVLGYAMLCSQAASTRDLIASDIDAVVNDPSLDRRLMDRLSKTERSMMDILGVPDETKIGGLIKFLFPIFSGSADDERFGRIQSRLNLLTMLYLDNPPFRIPRSDVEKFWAKPSIEFLDILREQGRISDFVGQLSRIMPRLDPFNDAQAWETLALETSSGTSETRAEGRRIADSLRDTLVALAERNPQNRARVDTIIKHLIKLGDFAIVPSIVRLHMFAHGLVDGKSGRGGPVIYDALETKALLEAEIPRYSQYVKSGEWLNGSGDSSPIFALEQAGAWSEQLRVYAESQLDAAGAVEQFAALFTPPGWSIESGTVERFVSEQLVLERLAERKSSADPWLTRSAERLTKNLKGKNPDFE